VEQSHDVGVNRALLWRAVLRQGGSVSLKELLADLPDDPLLRQRAAAEHLRDTQERDDLAAFSILEEFGRPPASARNTLETLGLVEVVYPDLPRKPEALGAITDDEWAAFVAAVLDLVRSAGCVHRPTFDSETAKELGLDQLLPFLGKSLVLSAGIPEQRDEDDDAADDDVKVPSVALIGKEDAPRSRFAAYAKAVSERVGVPWEDLLNEVFRSLVLKQEAGCRWLRKGPASDSLQIVLKGLALRAHESPPLLARGSGAVHFRSVRGVVPGPSKEHAAEAQEPSQAEVALWRARHAVRRVWDDDVLGMWAIEHTAQIDVDSLEDLEGDFRRGGRNLLASSTTMEMGVDIGGLTLVVLTNVPPGPANYWQRAGRAGRRADGTSMTLTLALPNAHDQLVFHDPRRFLYAAITPPRVRLDAEPLLARHVHAFLLAQFFELVVETGAQGNPMRAFGTVEEAVFESAGTGVNRAAAEAIGFSPQDPLWIGFRRWLESLDDSSACAARVRRLCKNTVLSAYTLAQLASAASDAFASAVEHLQRDAEVIEQQKTEEERRGAAKDEAYLRALEFQRRALVRETLIGFLAGRGFLPSFGFPLDVVRLNTKWRLSSGEDRSTEEVVPALRMERSLDLALAEYVPGDEVVAGKRVFRSAGIERNWFSEQNALDRHFYFKCVRCKHTHDGRAQLAKCPVCGHATETEQDFLHRKAEEQEQRGKARRRKRADHAAVVADESIIPPSVIRSYLRPSGFAVKLNRKPRRVVGDVDRVGPTFSSLSLGADRDATVMANGGLTLAYCPESSLFVRSEGKPDVTRERGFGFAICRICGYSEPETGWATKLPPTFLEHGTLRGNKKCAGPKAGSFWRHAVLGTSISVDAVRVELSNEFAPRLRDAAEEEAFNLTLAAVLQLVIARRLQVDLRALASTVATRQTVQGGYAQNAVVYEKANSGLLADVSLQPAAVLGELRALLESGDDADFVRFDTQFLGARLRPDLLRAHFADPERQKLLELRLDTGERLLRGASAVTWSVELLEDPAQALILAAPALRASSFDAGGLLPHVRHRAADPAAAGTPVRLLVAVPPEPGRGEEEALAAARLRQLIESGVQVRKAPALREQFSATRWHLASRRGATHAALGGVWAPGAHEPLDARFGPRWFAEGTPVEADRDAASTAWQRLDGWWAAAQEISLKDLEKPTSDGPKVVLVPQGVSAKPSCVPSALLAREFQDEGGLPGLGQVTRLVYSDRYAACSALSLYYLRDLLAAFNYASGARAVIRTHGGDLNGRSHDPAKLFTVDYIPPALDDATSAAACTAIRKVLEPRVAVEFKTAQDLPHPRKLLVEFASGSRLRSLVVRFDHGLAWARVMTRKGQKWPDAPAVSKETHAVIWRDKGLKGETGWL
jgi:hypothetical protein